jgi:putative membrane protein
MNRSLLLAAAAAFALAGCAAEGDMDAGTAGTGMAAAGDMTPTDRAAYVDMAAASDLYEIQAGQLAQSRASNADVRQFGSMLVEHHRMTTQQLTAAATAAGTPPSPRLMPMQQRMIAELQSASGSGFDRIFLRQQVQAHEMALALHRNYADNGDTPALRTVASAAVPIIQRHLDRARQLG